MKHFFALLLSVLMVLSLLTACGDKTTPSDGDDQTVTDENGGDTDNNTDDTTDPYDAVRNYWSEDQLTQAWGPDQVVEHLFFHPIIAYPQWAFHDCNASQDQRYGLDDWMVTADEYKKILQSVYDKGYILVAMEDVWSEVTDESGTHMVRNTLMLPEGKKPLVISFDDVNYYPYMLDEGFTSKLVVGEDGEIWAQCTDPYTNETFLTKELDATPILDQFVYEHPDFSLNGAKAIFSLTGYQGILGYRTQDDRDIAADSPDRPAFDAYRASEIEAVKPVIARLKETGWTGGRPDGDDWHQTGERFKYLQSQGFRIFASVGTSSFSYVKEDISAVICDRLHPDGTTLRHARSRYLQFYNAEDIMDTQVRPDLGVDW